MSRKNSALLVLIFIIGCTGKEELKLWYDRPAQVWEATLPLGNGRLGMMPDGNLSRETIVLNEISLWSGSVQDASNPRAKEALPLIRELLQKGQNHLAQELMYENFVCGGEGSGHGSAANLPFGCYQVLGNLSLSYSPLHVQTDNSQKEPQTDSSQREPQADTSQQELQTDTSQREPQTDTSQREQEEAARRYKNYRRELNLRNATATTTSKGEKRAYFTSFAHDVGVVRIKSAKKKRMVLRLDRPESFVTTAENGQLVMRGTLNSGVEGQEGMHYVVRIGVNTSRGHVTCSGDSIVLEGVRKTTLIFSAATSYSCEDPEQHSNDLLQAALSVKYRKLRRDHIRHYQPFFNRVALHLGVQKRPVALPTDQRLQQAQKANDSALDALYFHYGRYLFISSSRPGQLPPNLQGLWAHTIQTPWNGDYHLNINLPMNHWLAEPCNLPELHRPLIDFTKSLVPSGEHTARSFYGAPGWVAHVICNPWHFTAPGEHPSWGATQTGGAWLCQHLWNHYLYNKDTTYCKEVYPTMKGAAEFFLNTLVPDPSGRWLVTAPSISPENSFYMPQGKTAVQVCMGPAMDTQIIKELFSNTIQASELLQTDEEFRNQWQQALDKLAPDQISPQGYLQEWLEDYQETDLHHRHVSHLYGLFPGNSISPVHTPELAQACEKTLERRGDGGTGWSRAWKINFWARLKNGERAYRLLKLLLSPQSTYPNLFCSHPPFQIDGNFGGARGIVEMLLQEHDGFIDLLPALPKAWQAGFFKGLKVPGNIHVSCRWKKGKVRKVILEAPTGGTCTVSANGQQITVTLLPGEKKQLRFTR